ncbi:methylamine utilization protein [Paraglaciecola sp.]|uniref:methylamine utilization protein n=1 Tax=Paraglaciecola sp. TaxID=1920173 RepID=UPI0030F49FA6
MIKYKTLLGGGSQKTLFSPWLNPALRRISLSTFMSLVVSLSLFTLSHNTQAKTLKLVDQYGKPVLDAVVAIPANTETKSSPQKMAVMDQIDKQFLPRVLTITEGQLVSFPNSDDIRHHVYSFSATKPFEIKLFKGAVNSPIQFEKPGIVVLGCNIHDQMIGYIYVAHNEQTFISNPQGNVEVPDSVSGINIWHADLSTQNTQRDSIDISQLQPSDDGTIHLSLNLVGQQQVTEESPKSTSKFKKKFN